MNAEVDIWPLLRAYHDHQCGVPADVNGCDQCDADFGSLLYVLRRGGVRLVHSDRLAALEAVAEAGRSVASGFIPAGLGRLRNALAALDALTFDPTSPEKAPQAPETVCGGEEAQ